MRQTWRKLSKYCVYGTQMQGNTIHLCWLPKRRSPSTLDYDFKRGQEVLQWKTLTSWIAAIFYEGILSYQSSLGIINIDYSRLEIEPVNFRRCLQNHLPWISSTTWLINSTKCQWTQGYQPKSQRKWLDIEEFSYSPELAGQWCSESQLTKYKPAGVRGVDWVQDKQDLAGL